MKFIPNTILYICKDVPLNNDYRDTLTFSSTNNQLSYFINKAKYTLTNYSYQSINKPIRVYVELDKLYDCNYIVFQNANFGNKWLYAFIVNYEYINQTTAEIIFEIDVFQTWYFDFVVHPSFIEREHTNNDSIGANLIPENLETGDYKNGEYSYADYIKELAVVISTNATPTTNITGGIAGGVYTGNALFAYRLTEIPELNQFLEDLDKSGRGGGVSGIFMMPYNLLEIGSNHEVINYNEAHSAVYNLSKPYNNIDGYVPKNKKLFTYPYNFMCVTDFAGNLSTIKYEYSSVPLFVSFKISGSVCFPPSSYCIPIDYNGVETNYHEKIELKNYPMCCWTYGTFDNWLAANAINLSVQTANASANLLYGAANLTNPITAIATDAGKKVIDGATQIADIMATTYQHSIEPNQTRGSSTATGSNVSIGLTTFGFIPYFIRKEFAISIDNYFSMFGYATHVVKNPNIYGRESWNYVKTKNVKITGSIPTNDLTTIKNAFNNGITFWHGDYVGDYERSNNIV